jgi:hypothetical protein
VGRALTTSVILVLHRVASLYDCGLGARVWNKPERWKEMDMCGGVGSAHATTHPILSSAWRFFRTPSVRLLQQACYDWGWADQRSMGRRDMQEDDASRQRQEAWEQFSERQVNLLRGLRDQISSERWQIMLEVDSIQELARRARAIAHERDVQDLLAQMLETLDEVHKELARIPEDFIPPF